MRTLVILLCSVVGVSLGNTNCNTERATVKEIIESPHPNWNFDCLDERLTNEFLNNRNHIHEVVNCLEAHDLCSQPGYELIANEILDRIGSTSECFNCSPRLNEIVTSAMRRLQRENPDLLRRGLRYLS